VPTKRSKQGCAEFQVIAWYGFFCAKRHAEADLDKLSARSIVRWTMEACAKKKPYHAITETPATLLRSWSHIGQNGLRVGDAIA